MGSTSAFLYNGLLPEPGELAATMFIEIGDPAAIKPVLDALLGIDTRDYVRRSARTSPWGASRAVIPTRSSAS